MEDTGKMVGSGAGNSGVRLVDTEALKLGPGLPEQSYEAWADTLGGFGERKLVDEAPDDQVWTFNDWQVDNLRVRETTAGAEQIIRRPHHVRQSFCESVALHIPLRHSQNDTLTALIGDEAMPMRCGDVHIHDLNVPARIATPSSLKTVSVFIPYTDIGYDPSVHPTTISISSDTPAGRMLKNAVLAMRESLQRLSQAEAPLVAAGLNGLFRGLIVPAAQDEDSRRQVAAGKKQLVISFIEDHLFDSDLGTAVLCQQFAMSRATLYRLFAEDGGVANYLNDRRLIRSFQLLRSHPPSRGRVKMVAESLGFTDHSHFNRLFRRRFEISPSDAMGLWADPASASIDCD